ncbi:unnamed protein product [Lactuca saligna]|uniref:Arabidopsis retrotransposon Orf1 C-terminal domain-containing protein n=1 Tax=Lactuca saligna TaxID=75948 RepID=A0AA35VL25_LACSI|nr:unnamed protein product [Lactuca saligna]
MHHRPSRSRRHGDAPHPSYTVQADNIMVDLGSQATLDCYQCLLDREIMSQAWPPSHTLMRQLHIYDGVHALFANIGLERLLSVYFATCPLLTRGFLATLSEINHEGNLAFRIFSIPHTIHVDQLCTIFHTPITSLFQPTPAFDVREFWYSITGLPSYDSTSSVQTSIVHPAIKIALKIIWNIIYAQLETKKADKADLFLLCCMITGSYHPHFGDIIIRRFHRVIALRTGDVIPCGGLISIIARSLTPQSPLGYTFFTGDAFRLTLQNLRAMHMLHTAPGGYVWMHGHSTYFKLTGLDDIALADPISDTLWVLQSNIPPPSRPCRAQQV